MPGLEACTAQHTHCSSFKVQDMLPCCLGSHYHATTESAAAPHFNALHHPCAMLPCLLLLSLPMPHYLHPLQLHMPAATMQQAGVVAAEATEVTQGQETGHPFMPGGCWVS